jgi:macrolide transport system ATP-binding/permease protein
MAIWIRLRPWLQAMLHRSRTERDMDAELRFHIDAYAQDLIRGGASQEEAQRRALVEFGGVERAKEECRDATGTNFLDSLAQDLRFGLRMLRKNPGFTAAAVFTLALGIAANTTIFTAFDALVLRPRAVKDPDHLAFVFRTTPEEAHARFSYPDYLYYRDHSKSFSDLALFAFGMAVTSSDLSATGTDSQRGVAGAIGLQLPQLVQGSAQPIMCFFVSGNYFPMLGTLPLHGRVIEPEDDHPGASSVVLLSGNFWQRQFHSDPNVVGSVIHLNGVAVTVIGVTPVDYIATAPDVPNLWAPVTARVALGSLSPGDLESRHVVVGEPQGRLKPGVSFADAQAEVGVLTAQLRALNLEDKHDQGAIVIPGKNDLALLEPMEWALVVASMAAVALLLLIACANVASLMLARAAARRKEIAVRLALGAGRRRLLRQLLTESVMVGILAGAVGLALANWMLHLLIVQVASTLPSFWGTIALRISPDIRIFVYTALISCAAGVAFGLVPAFQASKVDVNSAIKDEGSTLAFRISRSRLRGLLVAAQIAACLILLINSALLLRGSQRALRVDPGYETRGVAYLEMYDPVQLHYSQERLLQLNRDLVRGVEGIPSVRSVAQASRGPIGNARWVAVAPVNAVPRADANESSDAGYSYISPNYFETLGIPILRGRIFTRGEAEGQAPVVIVSEATARRFWPNEDALGKRLKIGSEKQHMSFPGQSEPFLASSEVIGIAADVRSMDLTKIDESYVYLPLSPSRQWTGTLVARTEVDPTLLLPEIGRQVRKADPSLPMIAARLDTMVSMDPHFVISRVGGVLASIVGAMGLLLACIGVYGMVSYVVAQRTREIGIRMALGAQSGQVLRLVMVEGFRPILAGVVIGILASAAISRLLAATLFGLNPVDAVSFSGVPLFLCVIALLATYFPARRAVRVDPMIALRYE